MILVRDGFPIASGKIPNVWLGFVGERHWRMPDATFKAVAREISLEGAYFPCWPGELPLYSLRPLHASGFFS